MTTTLPWQAANAELLDVRGPGLMDDYGDVDASSAVTTWTGALEAQLRRTQRTIVTATGVNTLVDIDLLIVRDPPLPLTAAKVGDEGVGYTVLVRDLRQPAPVEVRFRLIALEHRARGEAEHVRYELEDPRTL